MNALLFPRISFTIALLGTAAACGGTTQPATTATASTPSDAYLAYVSAIGNAGSMSEILPFLSPAAKGRAGNLETVKAKMPGGRLLFLGDRIEGNKATVTVKATIQDASKREVKAIGTVVMVRDDGAWKVDQETWVVDPVAAK